MKTQAQIKTIEQRYIQEENRCTDTNNWTNVQTRGIHTHIFFICACVFLLYEPLFNCFYLCVCFPLVCIFVQLFLSVRVFSSCLYLCSIVFICACVFLLFVHLFNCLYLYICFPLVKQMNKSAYKRKQTYR
jgi:hypothetical protein